MSLKPSICTVSLGRAHAGHQLPHKLDKAAQYGFEGIELFYEDLLDFSVTSFGDDSQASQLSAARIVRELCAARHLTIIALQPFMHYEGLTDRNLHYKRLEEMKFWTKLAHTLGIDLILLPSSNLPEAEISADMNLIISDMIEVAEIAAAAEPPIRLAYEALCWGTRVDTWDASWEVVRGVNKNNFGICLDTFNLTGRIFADPMSPTGRTLGCEEVVSRSLDKLARTVPVDKIFLLQVADAELLGSPLDRSHRFYNPEQPPRMSWSRNARLFYGEGDKGGYLPILEVLRTVVQRIGFNGWLSFEVFSRQLAETKASVPEDMARRGAKSFKTLTSDLELRASEPAKDTMRPML